MKINFWRADSVGAEELGDLDVLPVLFPLEVVLYQNQGLIRRSANAIKLPIGSAFSNGSDLYRRLIEPRQMESGLPEQEISLHRLK